MHHYPCFIVYLIDQDVKHILFPILTPLQICIFVADVGQGMKRDGRQATKFDKAISVQGNKGDSDMFSHTWTVSRSPNLRSTKHELQKSHLMLT